MPFSTMLNWILFGAFLFVALRSMLRALGRRKNTTEPTCANCGYTVVGLTTHTCPECGKNLLASGILPPGKIQPQLATAFVYMIILLSAGAASTSLVGNFINYYTQHAEFQLRAPGSVTDPDVVLCLYSEGYSRHRPVDELDVYAAGPSPSPGVSAQITTTHDLITTTHSLTAGPQGTITFFRSTREWVLTNPAGANTKTKTLADADLGAWLTSLGDAPNPTRAHELAQILISITKAPFLESLDSSVFLPLTQWNIFRSNSGYYTSAVSNLLAANAWLFAFLWAFTLGPFLVRRPAPLRGDNAAHLLAQSNSDQAPGPVRQVSPLSNLKS